MIQILTKIHAKITIIVIENRGHYYYFITICKCKQVPLCLFSYQMLASTLTMDEQSIYYKVYGFHSFFLSFFFFLEGVHVTVFTKPAVTRDLFDVHTSVGAYWIGNVLQNACALSELQ